MNYKDRGIFNGKINFPLDEGCHQWPSDETVKLRYERAITGWFIPIYEWQKYQKYLLFLQLK